tara:strand:- start:4252 stop:4530 length:279 start_codon:yes stop_codon:yes gene_type:complete
MARRVWPWLSRIHNWKDLPPSVRLHLNVGHWHYVPERTEDIRGKIYFTFLQRDKPKTMVWDDKLTVSTDDGFRFLQMIYRDDSDWKDKDEEE